MIDRAELSKQSIDTAEEICKVLKTIKEKSDIGSYDHNFLLALSYNIVANTNNFKNPPVWPESKK